MSKAQSTTNDANPGDHRDYQAIVGRQVRRFRLQAGLTQEVLSERCGIFRTYLSRLEGGKANPSITVLAALADCLRVTVGELFSDS
jgi:transcriptional regulator with XRE-family HTH domain